MSDVKRYAAGDVFHRTAVVLASDYDALTARLAEVTSQRDAAERVWRDEIAEHEKTQARLAEIEGGNKLWPVTIAEAFARAERAETRLAERELDWLNQCEQIKDQQARLAEAEKEYQQLAPFYTRDGMLALMAKYWPDVEVIPKGRLAEVEIERDNARAAAIQNKELVEWNRARLAEAEARIDEMSAAGIAQAFKLDQAEARLAEAESALHIYGGHIPPCPGRPCYCGFQKAWEALSTNSPKVSSELVDSTPDSAPACLRCGGDGTVPSLDEYGFPARDLCPDCAPAADQPEEAGK